MYLIFFQHDVVLATKINAFIKYPFGALNSKAEIINSSFKLRYEWLTLLRKKLRCMKFYQPYPSKVVIEGKIVRDCWWKIKLPFITEENFAWLFPDKDIFYKIQPKPSYRPKSTVYLYKVEGGLFHQAFGVYPDLLKTPVSHLGKVYNANIADFVLLKFSKKTSKLEIIYKLNIYTTDGVKVEPHIQPRYLRLGRPKN